VLLTFDFGLKASGSMLMEQTLWKNWFPTNLPTEQDQWHSLTPGNGGGFSVTTGWTRAWLKDHADMDFFRRKQRPTHVLNMYPPGN